MRECSKVALSVLLALTTAAHTGAQRQFKEIEGLALFPTGVSYPYDIAAGDLDGDGDTDFVYANSGLSILANPNSVLLNDGAGTFRGRAISTNRDHSAAVALADVDGDGDLDVAFGNFSLQGSRSQNRLYLNDGTARFVEVTGTHMPRDGDETSAVVFGDIDRDGDPDLVIGNYGVLGGRRNRVYLNDGTGRFSDVTSSRMPIAAFSTSHLVLADVNGDGALDLVTANGGNSTSRQNRLFFNTGTGSFVDRTATHMPPDNDWSISIAVADVDNDGDADLVFGNQRQNRLYLNNGTGDFSDATAGRLPADNNYTDTIAAGDVDEDGDTDLVLGNGGPDFAFQQNRLYLNDGAGVFRDATSARMPVRRDETSAVVLADADGDDDLDLLIGNFGIGPAQPDHLYLNLHRQLSRPALPVLGAPYTLEVFAKRGYATSTHTAVIALGVGLAPQPIPVQNWGNLYLQPAPLYPLPPVSIGIASGMAVLQLPIPQLPALEGAVPYLQAWIVDDANPIDAHFTGYLADPIRR